MDNDGSFQRLFESLDYILLGVDLILSIAAAAVFSIYLRGVTGFDASTLIESGTSLTTSTVVVILTGISILVTMSDKKALVVLRKSEEYTRFLFTFEFTALLALSTSAFGIFLQSFGYSSASLIFFVFLLTYSITAIATVISRLITYGEKVATIAALEDLPDDLSDLVKHESEQNGDTSDQEESSDEKQTDITERGNSEI